MKNLIKVLLIATAFVFAAGCSTQEGAGNVTSTDNLSNVADNVHHGLHHKQVCKCKKRCHCKGKLGVEKNKCDTNK